MDAIRNTNSVFSNHTSDRKTTIEDYKSNLKQNLTNGLQAIIDETAKYAAKAYKTAYEAARLAAHSEPRKGWMPQRQKNTRPAYTIHHEALQAIEPKFYATIHARHFRHNPGRLSSESASRNTRSIDTRLDVFIMAAAASASQHVARRAVRQAALNSDVSPSGVSKAVRAALYLHFHGEGWRKLTKRDRGKLDDGFFQPVRKTSKEARQAFEGHFEKVASNSDTNIDITADIVVRSTVSGLLIAAKKAMQIAHKTADTYSKADGTINHAPSETDLKKVVSTTNVVPENTRHHFREHSREALAAFSLNKLYRSIFELHEKEFFSRTFWGRLKYSILIAGTVVGDQLMDVPGLLGPLVRKHFRERLHMPKKVKSDLEKGSPDISTTPEPPSVIQTAHVPCERPESQLEKDAMATSELSLDDLEFDDRLPFDECWRFYHRLELVLFSALTGVLYGSLHITKWHSTYFPSATEHLLWKISCCVGSLVVLPVALTAIIPFATEPRTRKRTVCVVLCALIWLVFSAARLYLIWESIVSLRALLPSAFYSVQWTNVIPHL